MKWVACMGVVLGLAVTVGGCSGDRRRSYGATTPGATTPGATPGAGLGTPSSSTSPTTPPPPAQPPGDLSVTLDATPLPLVFGEPLSLIAAAPSATGALVVRWSVTSAPVNATASFDPADALSTTAAFSDPGVYTVRVDLEQADGATGWAQAEVEVNAAPVLVATAAAPTVSANLRLALSAQATDDGLPRRASGISFTADVAPLLAANCVRCHAGGQAPAQAAFPLNDPPTQTVDHDRVLARIDPQAPDASLLLQKATNAGGVHMGGAVLSPTSPEVATLTAWIQQGAVYEPPAVTFDGQVYPLLRAECGSCHSNGAGGLLINADPTATYDQLITRFDPADPAGSLLVRKPAADRVTHGGASDPRPGFEVGGPHHMTLLAWIRDGAPRAASGAQPQPIGVTLRWERVDGPGRVVFGDATAPDPAAAFELPGTYTLRVTADDGQLASVQELQVEVTAPEQLAEFPTRAYLEQYPDTEETAEAYYQTIDPEGLRATFQGWLEVNEFGQNPDAEAIYFNIGDLGFGRRMIMERLQGGGVAYSTTNYANVDDTINERDPIAAVTMEFSPGPNGGAPFTKFYVYDGNGNRIPGADLDGGGFKYVPGLCITCHGGAQGTVANGVYSNGGNVGATWLPFDLDAFRFADEPGFRRQDQEADFKELNEGLLRTNISAATRELIEGWHGGPTLPLPTQQSDFVPQGFAGHEELYTEVVAKSCRTCHIRFDAPLDFATFDGLVGFGESLKRELQNRTMPDSRVTFENFWSSAQPALLMAELNMPHEPVPMGLDVTTVLTERASHTELLRAVEVRNDFYDMALSQGVTLLDVISSTEDLENATRARRQVLEAQGTDINRIRRFQLDAVAAELRDRERQLDFAADRLRDRVGQENALQEDFARLARDINRLAAQAVGGLAPNGEPRIDRPGNRREQRIQSFLDDVDELLRNQPGRVRDVLRARRAIRDASLPAFPAER